MDTNPTDRLQVLDAADALFYAHGIQAVSMDRIRDAAQIPLKRLYRVFPSKAALVETYLRRRDEQARAALRAYVADRPTPEARVLAVFDWLYEWYQQPEFRGCAFNNAFGEMGGDSESVAQAVSDHMSAIHAYMRVLTAEISNSEVLAAQLHILIGGATVLAAVHRTPEPACQARAVAQALLNTPAETLASAPPDRRTSVASTAIESRRSSSVT